MQRALVPLMLVVLMTEPVKAEDSSVSERLDLMGQGLSLLFEGLTREAGPMLGDTLAQLRPLLEDLAKMIDDLSAYEAPEILPNGDIIIRRKSNAPELPAPQDIEI